MSEAFDSVKYRNQFIRENYDRLYITVPKGLKAKLKEYAIEQGTSVNHVVSEVILKILYDAGKLGE